MIFRGHYAPFLFLYGGSIQLGKEEYIKVTDLKLGYGSNIVTENVSFHVHKGDYLCIVGENGAGKSTLMKTLLRLTPPLGGSLEYGDGLEASDIGYLPQQTLIQKDFPASVTKVVMSGNLSHLGKRFFYNSEDKKRTKKNMERMGITDLANKCYRDLSGGQQQRVMLARALCSTEKMLLLDEPVSLLVVHIELADQDPLGSVDEPYLLHFFLEGHYLDAVLFGPAIRRVHPVQRRLDERPRHRLRDRVHAEVRHPAVDFVVEFGAHCQQHHRAAGLAHVHRKADAGIVGQRRIDHDVIERLLRDDSAGL